MILRVGAMLSTVNAIVAVLEFPARSQHCTENVWFPSARSLKEAEVLMSSADQGRESN